MIDAVSFLIIILLSVGLSHVAFPYDYRNRLVWLVAPGIFLLFIVHPLALVFAFTCFVFSIGIFVAGCATDNRRLKARIPYLILLLLFLPDVLRFASDAPILLLGSAFFIIRQMMTVAAGLNGAVPLKRFFPALLMATFSFATLPSGPVFSGLQTWDQLRQGAAPAYREGCYRTLEGFVYLFAIAGFINAAIRVIDALAAQSPGLGGLTGTILLQFLAGPLAGFGFLFATFYGYSRMAEGSALLFGFEVPQNFNEPHLASDLSDFWRRWHRSMADFVMQHIYLPLLVMTSQAKLALIAAFVFMGLWHDFSIGFLVWGVGHGIGLAFVLPWARRHNVNATVIRVASLASVLILSSIAHGVWTK